MVYRDVTAVLAAVNTSGTAAVKICVNRAGVVTFSEIIPEETTIRDRATLKKFLKAARGYKVQPDLKAPKEQCGKLTFKNDNTINKKLKK